MRRQVAARRCINPLLPSIKTSDLQISDFVGIEATQLNWGVKQRRREMIVDVDQAQNY